MHYGENGLFELVDRRADMPKEADFCLTLSDDAMEPYFMRSSVVCVSAKRQPGEFETGVFWYDGKVYCRQWCEDCRGNMYLLPANPGKRDLCITVPESKRGKCLCLGSVICDCRLPKPAYFI